MSEEKDQYDVVEDALQVFNVVTRRPDTAPDMVDQVAYYIAHAYWRGYFACIHAGKEKPYDREEVEKMAKRSWETFRPYAWQALKDIPNAMFND